MMLEKIKQALVNKSIFYSEDRINDTPTVIGYEKKFRWLWVATQLNTFIVVCDLGEERVSEAVLERYLDPAFAYAKKHYRGWPRGLQSGIGVIVILISNTVDDGAIAYCKEQKSGKKWAGFSVPVVINSVSNAVYFFDRNPVWGRIYYPHFRRLIAEITAVKE